MSQPDDGRYKSRGRKERTPEQLKVLAMAREKAKLVIQERTKIKKELAGVEEPIEEPLQSSCGRLCSRTLKPPTPPPEPLATRGRASCEVSLLPLCPAMKYKT